MFAFVQENSGSLDYRGRQTGGGSDPRAEQAQEALQEALKDWKRFHDSVESQGTSLKANQILYI